ncbi:hypothetical protein [Nocardioides flavescens]|uniref:Uncharacterized protein n=1 Tax=Nocardioides flavescens TaxID=2691959 RepID=A0A6L7EXP9_9ACTN|nr:hypothetical protein [Nocardioides flavescens]MXG88471.1 hypothetical protein [Nocardioides flavescens]
MRLVAPVLVLSLLALAAPAHADTWSSRDRRADVIGYDTSPPAAEGDCGPPPRRVRSDARRDLLRLSVDHTSADIVVTLSMRAVSRRDRDTSYEVYLRTPGGVYSVSVVPGLGKDPGLFEVPTLPQSDPGDDCEGIGLLLLDTGCDGLARERDPVADTVTYTIPRDCLDRPAWVRVGAQVYGFLSGEDEGRSDRWGRQGTADVGFPPPLGPRVHPS